jgi:sortase (surface protein transpeptidase)
MRHTEGDINYYEVEPKGFVSGLFAGGGARGGGGSVAVEAGAAPADDDRGESGRSRRGLPFWILVGLAGFIVVMVIAIVLLGTGEASPAVSSPAEGPAPGVSAGVTIPPSAPVTEPGVTIIPPTTDTTEPDPTGPTVYTHPLQNPVRIVIPAISTGANIIPVGVEKEGVMQVPPAQKAGWYKLGPVPGAPGPAVIVAHVYYNHERDVFYQLKRLQPGDEIQVYDGSGDVALFVVDSKEEVLKNELPTEKIWNETAEPMLRLITCGGVFDPATRHYLSNVIVYAHLVE